MPRSKRSGNVRGTDVSEPKESNGHGTSLREEVKQALRNVLADPEASAAAKASAGRTLMEFFGEDANAIAARSSREMTASEIDAEIARLSKV